MDERRAAMPTANKSDLGVRVVSAAIMLAVAGAAIWAGGIVFGAFVVAIAAIALSEWVALTAKMGLTLPARIAATAAGLCYVVAAVLFLILFRRIGIPHVLLPLLVTIATDSGAYFAGRSLGGPKIAPKISPSKTWSGLVGGMAAAGIAAAIWTWQFAYDGQWQGLPVLIALAAGAVLAIFAQAGDFLESGMKRRAGVKDSGRIIPGHGGILDRIDGLLPVTIACGLAWLALAALVAE